MATSCFWGTAASVGPIAQSSVWCPVQTSEGRRESSRVPGGPWVLKKQLWGVGVAAFPTMEFSSPMLILRPTQGPVRTSLSCLTQLDWLPRWQSGKEFACQFRSRQRQQVQPLGWEDPLE